MNVDITPQELARLTDAWDAATTECIKLRREVETLRGVAEAAKAQAEVLREDNFVLARERVRLEARIEDGRREIKHLGIELKHALKRASEAEAALAGSKSDEQ